MLLSPATFHTGVICGVCQKHWRTEDAGNQAPSGSFQLIQLIKATNLNLYAAFAKLKSGVTPDPQWPVFLCAWDMGEGNMD